MDLSIKVVATDFDGTLHTEFQHPPVPKPLESLIGLLQKQGARWVVNTGRDLPSLLGALTQAQLSIWPDYLVVVEREIHCLNRREYVGLREWNDRCRNDQDRLFAQIQPALPELVAWIKRHFSANVYEDEYSPFCLVAQSNEDTDAILDYVIAYFRHVPELIVVRNDVYARFSHAAYNKGTALGEITRRLQIGPEEVFAAGDHWNDLPMLTGEYARWVAAPSNAVEEVKAIVRRQQGYVSQEPFGYGVMQGLTFFLGTSQALSDLLR